VTQLNHRVIGRYIKRLIYDEIIPVIPGEIRALERYAEEVIDRLRNPAIDHRLDSLSINILHNFDSAVLPTVSAHIEKNGVVSNRLAYAIALLIYFLRPSATDERSGEFAEFIKPLWGNGGNTQNEMVDRSRKIFNKRWEGRCKNVPNLPEQVGQHLYLIAELGVIESLKK
jgi:tagaturonate reductase